MPSLKELREKRAQLGQRIQELRTKHSAETGWASPDDKANWEQLNADYDAADGEVRSAKGMEEESAAIAARVARIAELSSTPAERMVPDQIIHQTRNQMQLREIAFRGWALTQYDMDDAVTDEHRAAARTVGVNIASKSYDFHLGGGGRWTRGRDLSEREMRTAMGISVSALGGYTVPEGFVANLEYALRAYGGVRNRAEVLRTETSAPLPWPTIADTTAGSSDPVYGGSLINFGEMLGENAGTSLQGTPPTMGAIVFGAQKFSSKIIQISTELLRDSAFDLASYIGRIMGERVARISAQKWAVGSGNGIVPRGIMTAAYQAYTTASAAGITFDDMIQFIFSLDPAYRSAPGCCFLLHDKLIGNLRLLKDGVGRYLWSEGSVQSGREPTIWDFPYETVMELPYDTSGHTLDATISTGIASTTQTKLILFGDVSKYKVREVGTLRMKRLVERFAEYDQDGFITFLEADGDLIDAGTHPVIALKLYGT